MTRVGLMAALVVLLGSGYVAAAQDSGTFADQPQSDDGGGEQTGQTAPVGAGTSDAVTTGVSGPDVGGSSDGITVPPVPSEELCQDYRDQPAYEPCLATVTGERSVQ